MNEQNRSLRAQSAMEYLMTYGWAILIIAVVLAALFSLNVFNSGAQLGTSCIGQPGYSCSSPVISQNGALSFTLGQGSGFTAYSAYLACVSGSNTLPPGSIAYYPFNQNGLVQSSSYQGGTSLTTQEALYPSNNIANGGSISIQNLQCYPGPGVPTSGMLSPIGSSFTGTVWMAWGTGSPWTQVQYTKIATISVKSSS
jgi:hypothetical protein